MKARRLNISENLVNEIKKSQKSLNNQEQLKTGIKKKKITILETTEQLAKYLNSLRTNK